MQNIWDEFISTSNNGTVFQKQSFLAYHIERKFTNHSLLFYKKKKLICVFPAAIIIKNKQKILFSHPGASFGGLIFQVGISFSLCNAVISSFENYCKKLAIDSLIMINTPLVYYKQKNDSLNYLLLWKKYSITEYYISHYIDLYSTKNLKQLLNKRKQRYLKNLLIKKTFNIKRSHNFSTFYRLLVQSKKTFQTTPTHSLAELKKLQLLFPNGIQLFLTKKDKNIVGGTVLFLANKRSSLVFYNVVRTNLKNSQLAMLQLYNAMLVSKINKCKIIDLGISHTPENINPHNPKFSLIDFKEQLGAKGVIRLVYKKDF